MAVVINAVSDAKFIGTIGRGLRQAIDVPFSTTFTGTEVLRALLEMPLAERRRLAARLVEGGEREDVNIDDSLRIGDPLRAQD